jgi:Ni/Fe-hydrogenase subunit HybB-like protein
MPIIFLLSAIVSGMALLIVLYISVSKIRKTPLDHDCLGSMLKWLGGFLTVAIALEGLEVVSMLYMSEESWEVISHLISEELRLSYLGIQFGLGALLPLIILGTIVLINFRRQVTTTFGLVASTLILVGVFAMRWNVVIGGQLFSKSFKGFISYSPPLMGKEGILVSLGLMMLPFAILAIIAYLIPPWQPKVEPSRERRWGAILSG